jgi:hypothetical protein
MSNDTLAAPQAFNEALGAVNAPTSISRRREGDAPRIITANSAPRINIVVPTGLNKTATVQVVDKSANFCPEPDMLRARWHDVVRRPSGKVTVYDAQGAMVARFETWEMAAGVFKKADILKAVENKLEKLRVKREAEEKAAAAKAARR